MNMIKRLLEKLQTKYCKHDWFIDESYRLGYPKTLYVCKKCGRIEFY